MIRQLTTESPHCFEAALNVTSMVTDLSKLFRDGEELSLGVGNPRFPSLLYKTLTLVKVKKYWVFIDWVFYRFTADKQR